MLAKKKEVFKLDKVALKNERERKQLFVVDVSAVGRYHEYNVEREEAKVRKRAAYLRYQKVPEDVIAEKAKIREPLTATIKGEVRNTNVLYGFMKMMQTYGYDKSYVFCFDTPKNLLKQADPTYKKGRMKASQEYFWQTNVFRNILMKGKFNALAKEGYEADHMIFEAVEQNYDEFDDIYVITTDKDLSALVSEKVSFIDVAYDRPDITMDNYEEVLKCPYNLILLKKCLCGDKSDGIAGINRFGPKAFEKFIEENHVQGDVVYKEVVPVIEESNLKDEQKEQALYAAQFVLPLDPDIDATYYSEEDYMYLAKMMKLFEMNATLKDYLAYAKKYDLLTI